MVFKVILFLEEASSSSNQELAPLCEQLSKLEPLWESLSRCLLELEHTPDHHAVLVLQVSSIIAIYNHL